MTALGSGSIATTSCPRLLPSMSVALSPMHQLAVTAAGPTALRIASARPRKARKDMLAPQGEQGPVELCRLSPRTSSARGLARLERLSRVRVGDFLQKHWIVELLKT